MSPLQWQPEEGGGGLGGAAVGWGEAGQPQDVPPEKLPKPPHGGNVHQAGES